MDALAAVFPVAVILGGAVLYTKCVATKTAKKASNKQSTASDDEVTENDFLSSKQLKERAEKEKRAQQQQNQYQQLQKKKEKEEARRLAHKAKEVEEAEAAAALANTKGKSGKSQQQTRQQPQQQQQQKGKQPTQQQQQRVAEEKKQAAALKKKQDTQRQKDLQAKMEKQLSQQDQKNAIVLKKGGKDDNKAPAVVEDPEWTTVISKAQRKKLAQKRVDSDDEGTFTGEVEVISADEGAPEPIKEEKVTIIVPVPFEKRFSVIGTAGATIEQIREKTGCWVVVPKEEDRAKDYSKIYNNAPSNIKVEGPKSGAAMAKKIILELVDKGFSPTLSGGAIVEAKIQVPVEKRSLVLGPGGKWLKAMQEKLEVKIIMPDRLSRDTVVRIGGSRDGTNACKKAITQLLAEGYSSITHPTWIKHTLDFDSSYRRRLIGRAGQVIKQLQTSTRCKISFPPSDEKNVVYILGEQDNIQLAISRVNKLVHQIEFDEEEADLQHSLGEDGDEFDEDQLQYLYIPDEDETY
jgi:rRNA processing protein Krr1/Pno1